MNVELASETTNINTLKYKILKKCDTSGFIKKAEIK